MYTIALTVGFHGPFTIRIGESSPPIDGHMYMLFQCEISPVGINRFKLGQWVFPYDNHVGYDAVEEKFLLYSIRMMSNAEEAYIFAQKVVDELTGKPHILSVSHDAPRPQSLDPYV